MKISDVTKALQTILNQTTRIIEWKEHHDSYDQYMKQLQDGGDFYNRIANAELDDENEIMLVIEAFNAYPFTFRIYHEGVPMIQIETH